MKEVLAICAAATLLFGCLLPLPIALVEDIALRPLQRQTLAAAQLQLIDQARHSAAPQAVQPGLYKARFPLPRSYPGGIGDGEAVIDVVLATDGTVIADCWSTRWGKSKHTSRVQGHWRVEGATLSIEGRSGPFEPDCRIQGPWWVREHGDGLLLSRGEPDELHLSRLTQTRTSQRN